MKIFVDTNILVYAYDRVDAHKQATAINLLDVLFGRSAGWLSMQILGEMFVGLIKRRFHPLGAEEARAHVELYARTWPLCPITSAVVLDAMRGTTAYQLPYWDAQIWATAKLYQIPYVVSEDFQDGQVIEGVEFLNPFLPQRFRKVMESLA